MFSQHREEGGEQGNGEAREKDSLDANHRGWWTCPRWEGWNIASESGIVDFIDEDAEESGGLVTRVGAELRVDLDDECGGYGREQTSLVAPELTHVE